jgi:hypothetical protein
VSVLSVLVSELYVTVEGYRCYLFSRANLGHDGHSLGERLTRWHFIKSQLRGGFTFGRAGNGFTFGRPLGSPAKRNLTDKPASVDDDGAGTGTFNVLVPVRKIERRGWELNPQILAG